MLIGILGNKIGMTQIFNNDGNLIPITLVKCDTCKIIQIKNKYNCNSIQIGTGLFKNYKKIKKPILGHFTKNNLSPLKFLKEFKVFDINQFKIGDDISLNQFNIGSFVNVQAKSIGKGYAGNIKKNNFKRGPESHGSKHHRLQGSLGAGTTPSRVFPGKKMSGHLGFKKTTIKNLEIINLDFKNNIISIKGSIPGKKGSLIKIYPSIKK